MLCAGRWGDSRSAAFGDLSDYYLAYKRMDKVDRTKIWGEPTVAEDVSKIFQGFLSGSIPCLPWCDVGPSPETSHIDQDLMLVNGHGFLTINSQPRVNGAPSTDPHVGWGGPEGYVYQKV